MPVRSQLDDWLLMLDLQHLCECFDMPFGSLLNVNCNTLFLSRHWQTSLTMQAYNEVANQTSLRLTLAATNKSMSVLASVSLRVSQSALSSQEEPKILLVDSMSALPVPEHQFALHSSCDDNGLQSSVEMRQVAFVAGQAIIEVWSLLV